MHLSPLTALCIALAFTTAHAQVNSDDIYQTPVLEDDYLARQDGDSAAAIEAAGRQVEQLRANAHDSPRALASALVRLGDAHLNGGDHATAATSYTEALQVLEDNVSLVDPAQLEPLRGLGLALARADQHALAVPYLERAVMIFHRAHGVLSPSQQGLLYQLANSLWYSGRAVDAQKQLQYLQRVGEHAYGPNDPRLAQVFNIIGTWYVDNGNFILGRDHYRRAMQVIERGPGQRDPALTEPLRLLARSYTQELHLISQGLRTQQQVSDPFEPWDEPRMISPRRLDPLGERALTESLTILAAQPEPDAHLLTRTLVQTGDWFNIDRQPDKALPYYHRAAQTLAALPAPEEGHTLLNAPVRLYYPLPVSALRHQRLADTQVEEKVVTVTFTVTPQGGVIDERVTQNTGTQRHQSETLQAIRSARYRPRIVDGQAVATENVALTQVFRTRRNATGDEETAAAQDEEQEQS